MTIGGSLFWPAACGVSARTGHASGASAAAESSSAARRSEMIRLQSRHRRRSDMGDGGICIRLEHYLLAARGVCKQRPQQHVVQRVARLVAAELANEAVAEQVEIPDRIENLVLDE